MIRIVVLLGLCLFTISSWAQIKDIEFIAGPTIGMLRSNMVDPIFETKANYRAKIGYSVGVGSNYFFNEKFSLGARILYQSTSVHGDFTFSGSSYYGIMELTTSFDYISLPIMARYTVGNKVKFTGEAGGFVNYLLNAEAKDYFVYDSSVPNYIAFNSANAMYAQDSEQYTRFDAGVSLGLSSQIPLGKKLGVKLSAYDNYGLVDIRAMGNPGIPIRENKTNYLRSNTVNLLVGIVYQLL